MNHLIVLFVCVTLITACGGGGGGSGTSGIEVTVSTSQGPVNTGTPFSVSWNAPEATSCLASGAWSGSKPSTGIETVSVNGPSGSYTYTLVCDGEGRHGEGSASITVNALSPNVSISANPTNTYIGGSANLTWTASNSNSCAASGDWSGNRPLSGSESTGTLQSAGTKQYTLTCTGDGGTQSSTATVTVAAGPQPNRAPTTNNKSLTGTEDAPLSVSIQATDPDGDTLTYSVQSLPSHGSIESFSANQGTFIYRPSADFNGSDSMQVKATDTHGLSAVASITFSIEAVDDPPVITITSDVPKQYEKGSVLLHASLTDIDGQPPGNPFPVDDTFLYSWTQTAGTSGEFFGNIHSKDVEFVMPEVASDSVVRISFTANDQRGNVVTKTIDLPVLAYHDVSGAILSNKTWSSPDGRPLHIKSKTSVASGVTLTIVPGTVIRLGALNDGSPSILSIAGTIKAIGTGAKPIFFQSENYNHVSWDGMGFAGDSPVGLFSFVVIEQSARGLQIPNLPGSSVTDVVFRDNQYGIGDAFRYGKQILDHLTFLRNGSAVLFVRASEGGGITNSLFKNNVEGFSNNYITPGGFTISGSSFIGNDTAIVAPEDCCFYETIDARNNYWGTTNVSQISGVIIDKSDDATLLAVPFQPFLSNAPANVGARFNPEVLPSIP